MLAYYARNYAGIIGASLVTNLSDVSHRNHIPTSKTLTLFGAITWKHTIQLAVRDDQFSSHNFWMCSILFVVSSSIQCVHLEYK